MITLDTSQGTARENIRAISRLRALLSRALISRTTKRTRWIVLGAEVWHTTEAHYWLISQAFDAKKGVAQAIVNMTTSSDSVRVLNADAMLSLKAWRTLSNGNA